MGSCCTRRLVVLPRALLKRLIAEHRLSLRDDAASSVVPESCFLGCRAWGESARDTLVPGGVIVGLAATCSDGVVIL